MKNEKFSVRYVFLNGKVCDLVKDALKDNGFELTWSNQKDIWLFQFDNMIEIRYNDSSNKTLATIDGELHPYLPNMAKGAFQVFAPGAISESLRVQFGLLEDVKDFRQKLIVMMLELPLLPLMG